MVSKKVLLGYSKNGLKVTFDPVNSHAATHFEDTPQLASLVKEILANTVLEGELVYFDTDMGRIVGTSDLVETDENDELVYAKRKNRDIYTVFTKSQTPQPSSLVSVYFERQADGSYALMSAWIGPSDSQPFPGDENETPESKTYWSHHALVWGNQEIQPGTETAECPW